MEGLRTRLVQRLDPKPESKNQALVSRAFGGGMLAISDSGWDLIQEAVDLHYMGAAEYEFGAISECLSVIVAGRDTYNSWDFLVKGSSVKKSEWRKWEVNDLRKKELMAARAAGKPAVKMGKKHRMELEKQCGIVPVPDQVFYVISAHDHPAVEKLIMAVADGTMETKRSAGFDLDPNPKYTNNSIGWLDLNNNLMWFSERGARDAFASLLGICNKP